MKKFPRGIIAAITLIAILIALAGILSRRGSAPVKEAATAPLTTPAAYAAAATTSPEPSVTPTAAPAPIAATAPVTLFRAPGVTSGTRVNPRAPDLRRVSSAAVKSAEGRAAAIPLGTFAPLALLREGDRVTIPLMDGRSVSGRVNLVQKDAGAWVRVGGRLDDDLGTFSLGSKGTEVSGLILLDREKLAYQLETQRDGNLWIIEKRRSDVVCDPMPRKEDQPEVAALPAGVSAAVPILNSRPGVTDVLYLDFDGETVTDNSWNGGVTIVAASYNLSSATISAIFDRVKEDWFPFKINVTTDVKNYNSAAIGHRMRVIITPTDTAAPGAGGVAYLTSFRNAGTGTFQSDIPCWVFNSDIIGISEAISHELGHTMGLSHDGQDNVPGVGHVEYYLGQGTGNTSWAPIMGAGYYVNLVQWSKGEYLYANNQEDDLAIISASYNHFGYMPDDAGNTRAAASALSGNATTGAINQTGLVERTGDIDYYTFFTNGGTATINAQDPSSSPDLDIVLELENADGSLVATAGKNPNNPIGALNASVTATLPQGQYYVKVSPTGEGDPLVTGYTNYASLGQYVLTGTVTNLSQTPIVTSSATASGQVGALFGYTIKASGNPTGFAISSGTLPPGLSLDPVLGVISGYPTQPGTTTITVGATNVSGTGFRDVAITIAPSALTLGEALDFPTLTWTTSPGAPWVGETNVTSDGQDAVQAPAIGDNEEASFETVVDGPVTLGFNWKVSSEQGGDFLIFQIDHVDQPNAISGVVDWTAVSVPIPAGTHTLTWVYRKNGSISQDPDTAWVDAVTFLSTTKPTVTSGATASGTVGQLFNYQILATNLPSSFGFTGTLPAGLSFDPETGIISGVPPVAVSTAIFATATNNIGPSDAMSVTINIAPSPITLAEAVDDATSGPWSTTAAAWYSENVVTKDGVDAVQSGPIGATGTTSITKTVSGFNTVNFWWKVECDPTAANVTFFLDGTPMATLSGVHDWENVSIPLGTTGSHTLTWTYSKTAASALDADTAWLDEVVLTTDLLPAITSTLVVSGTQNSAIPSYQIVASNLPTSFGAQDLPAGITIDGNGLISGTPTGFGTFNATITAGNQAGTDTETLTFLIAKAPPTLADALDAPNQTWTTPDVPWTAETSFSFDGEDAARSGAIGNNGTSSLVTHVTGPAVVSFRWTVDSETNKDFLRFYIDSTFKDQTTGLRASASPPIWDQKTYTLDAGDHLLEWVYTKDVSASQGQDAGWVDTFTVTPINTSPEIVSPLSASAFVGRPFTYQIAVNNPATSYSASGLPALLTLDTTTGTISGIPQAAGTPSIILTGSNASGPGSPATLLLTILDEPPGADAFAQATPLSGVLISVVGDNTFATGEPGEPSHAGRPAEASVWYSWTAPLTGAVNITTAGSAIDTLLSVYEGSQLDALTVVAENDDTGKSVTSAVKFNAVAGHTYMIAVDSLGGVTGKIVLNIIYAATGHYSGLLKDSNGVASPGLATISLTPKFSFTGAISLGAKKFALSGDFTGEDFAGVVPRGKGLTPLQVSLHLDLSPGAEEITGKVTADGVTYDLFAKLSMNKIDVPAALPGVALPASFTFIIEQDDVTTPGLPRGTGYGAAAIDKTGRVKAIGTLGDGTKFSSGATLATDESWDLFLTPYKAGGVCAGEVLVKITKVGPQGAEKLYPQLASSLIWARSRDGKAKLFAPGFPSTPARLKGYGYTQPGKGTNVLSLTTPVTSVQVQFAGSDLAQVPAQFTTGIDSRNNLSSLPNGLKWRFAPASGLFGGSFPDPAGGKQHSFGGAIINGLDFIDSSGHSIQESVNRGAGAFIGTQNTGTVDLTPGP